MNAATNWCQSTLPKNQILTRTLPTVPDFRYLLRLSTRPDHKRVLVVVHGISRQSEYMLRCLEVKAQELNYTLIAPVFGPWSYRDYQRLGRKGQGHRADIAFEAMLADVGEVTELKSPVHLMGFSGGAQFAHRYAYSDPDRVCSLSLSSAGWYTDPKSHTRFPYGTAENKLLPGLSFDIDGFLTIPTQTMVGVDDTKRDPAMRRSPKLDKQQGRNRVVRAQWFQKKIERLAIRKGIDTKHIFRTLPNTGHDFGEAIEHGGLTNIIFNFCEDNL